MTDPPGSSLFATDQEPLRQARFVLRRNRFVLEVDLLPDPIRGEVEGEGAHRTTASLPNPGRLGEILLPDVILNLRPGPAGGIHPWRVSSARLPTGETVYLDTGGTNGVARYLLENQLVPTLAPYRVERAEASLPGTRSRIDYVLTPREASDHHDAGGVGGATIRYLEVKSCTLFNGPFAMFPDAVTERGRRHVEELAETGAGAVLFIVHSLRTKWFVPDFHSDLAFSRSLARARFRLPIIPVGVGWSNAGALEGIRTDISIPWSRIDRHLVDTGLYMVLLSNPGGRVGVGAMGTITLDAGWYIYVGSARSGLTARVARHRRRGRKRMHWHIDYLREASRWEEAFLVREPLAEAPADNREAALAAAVEEIADGSVPGFGSTDSPRASHLFYFTSDPRRRRAFVELLLAQRRRSLLSGS